MLSKKTINEFKEIYLRKEGISLSDRKALEIATNLILAFEAIYKPIPKQDKKRLKPLKKIEQRSTHKGSKKSRPLPK